MFFVLCMIVILQSVSAGIHWLLVEKKHINPFKNKSILDTIDVALVSVWFVLKLYEFLFRCVGGTIMVGNNLACPMLAQLLIKRQHLASKLTHIYDFMVILYRNRPKWAVGLLASWTKQNILTSESINLVSLSILTSTLFQSFFATIFGTLSWSRGELQILDPKFAYGYGQSMVSFVASCDIAW